MRSGGEVLLMLVLWPMLLWLALGPIACIALTAAGWRLERSAPLAETRSRRIGLGLLLVLSALVMYATPVLVMFGTGE